MREEHYAGTITHKDTGATVTGFLTIYRDGSRTFDANNGQHINTSEMYKYSADLNKMEFIPDECNSPSI